VRGQTDGAPKDVRRSSGTVLIMIVSDVS